MCFAVEFRGSFNIRKMTTYYSLLAVIVYKRISRFVTLEKEENFYLDILRFQFNVIKYDHL